MRKPRPLAVNNVALLAPLRSVQFSSGTHGTKNKRWFRSVAYHTTGFAAVDVTARGVRLALAIPPPSKPSMIYLIIFFFLPSFLSYFLISFFRKENNLDEDERTTC